MTIDEIKAALAPFGATLDDRGFIAKNGATSVRPVIKGRRLRFESESGLLLASGRPCAEFVADFVSRYWYWRAV